MSFITFPNPQKSNTAASGTQLVDQKMNM